MTDYSTVKQYLTDLKVAMGKADQAVIVEAMDDAEEHLRDLVQDLRRGNPSLTQAQALTAAVAEFGDPAEVAEGYIIVEGRRRPEPVENGAVKRNFLTRVFGVYWDPWTYGALLYLFLMFPLGIIYFVYIVTGISLTAGLIITIIGIPLGILFLMSLAPIGWLHGRLTEALLGIRMPRKHRRHQVVGTVWQRFKAIVTNPRTYSSMLYLVLMFPLGIIYFVMLVLLLVISLVFMLSPIAYLVIPENISAPLPLGIWVLVSVGGFIFLTWGLHLVRILADWHGRLSKALLLSR